MNFKAPEGYTVSYEGKDYGLYGHVRSDPPIMNKSGKEVHAWFVIHEDPITQELLDSYMGSVIEVFAEEATKGE